MSGQAPQVARSAALALCAALGCARAPDSPGSARVEQRSGALSTATWTRLEATDMSPRTGAATTYDARRQRVVLFGGSTLSSTLFDTREWDGTVWTDRTPALANPPPRSAAALAYDAFRERVVLFGGSAAATLTDTWEWDGTTWAQRTPPPPFP